jgi:hypothetical protein
MSGPIAGMLVGILLGAMASPATAQSLGDVARREAARREQIKTSGKVLTNADLPASAVVTPSSAPAPSSAPDTATEGAAEAGAPAGKARAAVPAGDAAAAQDTAAAKPGAAPKDDEDGWRQRAGSVNKTLAEARAQVRQLKALSDRLSLEMQASNPDIVKRATGERQDVKAQIAAAEAREADAFAARQALEQDARLAGVPPAWIQ